MLLEPDAFLTGELGTQEHKALSTNLRTTEQAETEVRHSWGMDTGLER